MIRFVVTVSLLTLIYTLALAHFEPWDFLLGAILASGVYFLFQSWVFPIGDLESDAPSPPLWRRLISLPGYVWAVVANITRGSIQVMLYVLKVKPVERQGIIGVPFGRRSEVGVVISGYADTLAPGSVIVEYDLEREISWTHVIDATDPERFREETEELYEQRQRHVIP